MTVTLPDSDLDLEELYERLLPCQVTEKTPTRRQRCSRPASWRVVTSCCRHESFLCDPHWQVLETVDELHCVNCGSFDVFVAESHPL